MAKVLPTTVPTPPAATIAPPDPNAPTTQEEQDARASQERADAIAAAEKTLTEKQGAAVKLSTDTKTLKEGGKYYFFNVTEWALRDPYSKAHFPAKNRTPDKVEANKWIISQVAAGLLTFEA